MSEINVEKLLNRLPKDYARKISTKMEISRHTVYTVVKERKLDHPVFEELIKLAEEHQAKITDLQRRLNKIAS